MRKPRWLSLVLREVGLSGRGERGDRSGDLIGASGVTGDFRERTGRVVGFAVDVLSGAIGATLMESFGLIDLVEESILNIFLLRYVVTGLH